MTGRDESPPEITGVPRWLSNKHIRRKVAAAGASQLSLKAGASAEASAGRTANSFCLSFAEGARGTHDRNCISKSFISFINSFFQSGLELLQAVPVTTCNCIRRQFEQLADFFKGVVMPDFQHNDLPLGLRQGRQALHGFAFTRVLVGIFFEPPKRFQFPRQSSPQAATVVERFIAESTYTIMFRLSRWAASLHQRDEGFLEDILGFAVA